MLKRIKQWLGIGHTNAIILGAANSVEMQAWLLEPSNSRYLRAFVARQKYLFDDKVSVRFFTEANRDTVLMYLGYTNTVNEACIQALLARKDKEMTDKLLSEKLWVPFPYGTTLAMSQHAHVETLA